MDSDTIADLKQFIQATVYQATSNMATKDDLAQTKEALDQKIDQVHAEVKQLTEDITDQFDTVIKVIDDQGKQINAELAAHDRRITRLERRAA